MMSESEKLTTFLVFARALTTSEPFDAQGAFQLLRMIDEEDALPIKSHLAAAIEASSVALYAREAHSSVVARYALLRVTFEIEGRMKRSG